VEFPILFPTTEPRTREVPKKSFERISETP
jgi:hypothetical protein